MGDWLVHGSSCKSFAQSLRRAPVPATSPIRFRERSSARQATKSAFLDHELDLMRSQGNIPFLPPTTIVDFHTDGSTRWAGLPISGGDHMHQNASVYLQALAQNGEFWQIERDHNPC